MKKSAGDISLSDSIDNDGDGNTLSLMDILAQDDDMFEKICADETINDLLIAVDKVLEKREKEIIKLRYGLGGYSVKTQREVAEVCGISRSYVSRIEKKAIEKLRNAMED